jgi:hypothetical protein
VRFVGPEDVTQLLQRIVSSQWIRFHKDNQVKWSDRLLVCGPRGALLRVALALYQLLNFFRLSCFLQCIGGGKSSLLGWLQAQPFEGVVVAVNAADVAMETSSERAPHDWLDAVFARVRTAARAGSAVLLLIDNVEAIALKRRSREGKEVVFLSTFTSAQAYFFFGSAKSSLVLAVSNVARRTCRMECWRCRDDEQCR